MCGRFTLTTGTGRVAQVFNVADPPAEQPPRYNVAPTQVVAVVGLKPDGVRRGLARLRWGLVPHWANSPKDGHRLVNVRSETARAKFGDVLRDKRCLIPADGFYEWKAEGKKKVPYRFSFADGRVFGFAGLWDVWGEGTDKLVTCCLLTTSPNDLVRPVHDRMPVILPPESYDEWLDPDTPVDRLVGLLVPHPAEGMVAAPANPAVNSPRNDGPECLDAA